jgi:Interferon-induced transmembrane protein
LSYQPPAAGPGPSAYGAPPQTYLVWSILNLIFCCLPFGIVALVFSVQAQSAITAGHWDNAVDLGNKAKGWNIAATVCGAVAVLGVLIIFGLAASHGAVNQQQNNFGP